MAKLLLVDDVDLFLELERSFLARESFEIATASSGPEALEKVRQIGPDLVLLDLFMPEMDGDQVCRTLKADPATRKIPVIMTTSVSREGPDARKRCFEAGCDDFIPKPLHRDKLLQVIGSVLQLAKRRDPRVPAHIRCTVIRAGETSDTWIHTLAVRGASVQYSDPMVVGEEMDLLFTLPGGKSLIETRGVARWIGPAVKGGPPGAGVEFVTISPGDRAKINKYVSEKLKLL